MIDSEGGAFGFDCYLASPEFRVFQQPARLAKDPILVFLETLKISALEFG